MTKPSFTTLKWKANAGKRVCRWCCGLNLEKKSSSPTSEAYSELFRWVKDRGGDVSAVSLQISPSGDRFLCCSRRVVPGAVVLSIPSECILSESQAIKLSSMDLKRIEKDSHNLLALFLLEQKALGPNSKFAPYVRTLPGNYAHVPVFSPRHDELVGTTAFDMLRVKKFLYTQEFEKLQNLFGDALSGFTLHDFAWARTVVITRVFRCDTGPNSFEEGLVPIADMMNHDNQPTAVWAHDYRKGAFVMHATRPQFRGQPMFDSYGNKCNSRFFVNYGFLQRDNWANNQVALFIPATPELKLAAGPCRNVDDHYSGYNLLVKEGLESKVRTGHFFRVQVPVIPVKGPLPEPIRWLFRLACLSAGGEQETLDFVADLCRTKEKEYKSPQHPVAVEELEVLKFYITLAESERRREDPKFKGYFSLVRPEILSTKTGLGTR